MRLAALSAAVSATLALCAGTAHAQSPQPAPGSVPFGAATPPPALRAPPGPATAAAGTAVRDTARTGEAEPPGPSVQPGLAQGRAGEPSLPVRPIEAIGRDGAPAPGARTGAGRVETGRATSEQSEIEEDAEQSDQADETATDAGPEATRDDQVAPPSPAVLAAPPPGFGTSRPMVMGPPPPAPLPASPTMDAATPFRFLERLKLREPGDPRALFLQPVVAVEAMRLTGAASFQFNGRTLTIPSGAQLALAVTSDRKRLFCADAYEAGAGVWGFAARPCLEDTDGDSRFDRVWRGDALEYAARLLIARVSLPTALLQPAEYRSLAPEEGPRAFVGLQFSRATARGRRPKTAEYCFRTLFGKPADYEAVGQAMCVRGPAGRGVVTVNGVRLQIVAFNRRARSASFQVISAYPPRIWTYHPRLSSADAARLAGS